MSEPPNGDLPAQTKSERVNLFTTCLVDQFAPQVGMAVVAALDVAEIEVNLVDGQTCCGQPAFNSGYRRDAREVAWRFVELFADVPGDIICPSGSCVAMVRNYYPVLFRDYPDKIQRARQVADRVYEFSEYLVNVLGTVDLGSKSSSDTTATYHKCCHLLRELHIDEQPELLLQQVKGLELVELERADVCCGFGGAFAVKMSDISTAMMREKISNIKKSGAKTVIAGDTGCIMHIQGGLRRVSSDVQVVHLAEILTDRVSEQTRV